MALRGLVAPNASWRALHRPAGGESASSIYFLLHPGERSAWHVVASAELWLYHLGSPLTLTLGGGGSAPDPQGDLLLGPNILAGQKPQLVVPPGTWQTARNGGLEPTLLSCVVSPAFHMDEFRLGASEGEGVKRT